MLEPNFYVGGCALFKEALLHHISHSSRGWPRGVLAMLQVTLIQLRLSCAGMSAAALYRRIILVPQVTQDV